MVFLVNIRQFKRIISGDCRPLTDSDLKTCETETDNEFALVDEATGKKSFYCSDDNVRPKR